MLTTQAAVRAAFWNDLDAMGAPSKRKGRQSQNDYPADLRMAFVDYVDVLRRGEMITEALAARVTL